MATQTEVSNMINKVRFWKAAAEMKFVMAENRLKRAKTHPREIEEALAPFVQEYNVMMSFIAAMQPVMHLLPK